LPPSPLTIGVLETVATASYIQFTSDTSAVVSKVLMSTVNATSASRQAEGLALSPTAWMTSDTGARWRYGLIRRYLWLHGTGKLWQRFTKV